MKDPPAHSGPGVGLGTVHRVVWFLTTTLSCSSAALISLLGQTLLLNTALLNILAKNSCHVRSSPTWLPHVQGLHFLFSVFLQCGKKKEWEAPISQQADPTEGTRPHEADYRRETIIRVFAPLKNTISFLPI